MIGGDDFPLTQPCPGNGAEATLEVLGVILERPLADKFRELCKPNTAEEVLETFVRNVIKANIPYNDYVKGEDK